MEFVAATNNAHKLAEMRRILVRMGHTVLSQREAGVLLEPEETGATFEANAAIKMCIRDRCSRAMRRPLRRRWASPCKISW